MITAGLGPAVQASPTQAGEHSVNLPMILTAPAPTDLVAVDMWWPDIPAPTTELPIPNGQGTAVFWGIDYSKEYGVATTFNGTTFSPGNISSMMAGKFENLPVMEASSESVQPPIAPAAELTHPVFTYHQEGVDYPEPGTIVKPNQAGPLVPALAFAGTFYVSGGIAAGLTTGTIVLTGGIALAVIAGVFLTIYLIHEYQESQKNVEQVIVDLPVSDYPEHMAGVSRAGAKANAWLMAGEMEQQRRRAETVAADVPLGDPGQDPCRFFNKEGGRWPSDKWELFTRRNDNPRPGYADWVLELTVKEKGTGRTLAYARGNLFEDNGVTFGEVLVKNIYEAENGGQHLATALLLAVNDGLLAYTGNPDLLIWMTDMNKFEKGYKCYFSFSQLYKVVNPNEKIHWHNPFKPTADALGMPDYMGGWGFGPGGSSANAVAESGKVPLFRPTRPANVGNLLPALAP